MDLQTYTRALRKHWRIIPATMLLFISLAALLTFLTPKTYSSNVQFFVSTSDTSDSAQLAQGGTFTQARVKSYTQLITTPKILQPVAADTKFPGGATAIKPKVTATAAPDTVIINAAVTDTSPGRATSIAKSLANHFPDAVAELERTSANANSPVKVTVVQDPAKAAKVGPSWPTNLVLGTLLGLLAGIALALLRDRFDTKIHTKEDIAEVDDTVTVLGTVPFDADAPNNPLIVETAPQSSRAEAFRSLRTNLQFVDTDNHPRVIVVTSSLAGEGKSTTTANLALAIAEAGNSVCLIEGDLRRPRLLEYMGLEGGVGLTDVLIGRAPIRTVAQRFGSHKLMVIGAGATPPNPSELLGSNAMREVLADLRSRFDYVIIDAPPLLPVTDAAVMSTLADGAVIISGSGIVNRDQLVTALDNLDSVNANLLGVVVNRVPRSGRGNYYDYKYEYRTDSGKRTSSASEAIEANNDTDANASAGSHAAANSQDETRVLSRRSARND